MSISILKHMAYEHFQECRRNIPGEFSKNMSHMSNEIVKLME